MVQEQMTYLTGTEPIAGYNELRQTRYVHVCAPARGYAEKRKKRSFRSCGAESNRGGVQAHRR